MNYVEHIVVGIGTAGLAVLAGQALGFPRPETSTLLTGVGVIAAGAIAVDIDHPQAFVSAALPRIILRTAAPLIALAVGVAVTVPLMSHSTDSLVEILRMPFVQWAAAIIGLVIGLTLISWLISHTLGHRGPLHSLTLSVGMTVVAVGILWSLGAGLFWWGLGFGWGWLSHVLADGLTEQGMPLWWPLASERVHVLPYPHFKWAARVAVIVAILSVSGNLILRIRG